MAFAKISQVAHYAPAQVVTNDDLSKIMDTSDEWIRSRTGIQERRISLNENTSDLATNVAHQLLEKSGLSPEELDFVLVATISPDSSMPSVAARVQGAIGAVNAFAFIFIFPLSDYTPDVQRTGQRKDQTAENYSDRRPLQLTMFAVIQVCQRYLNKQQNRQYYVDHGEYNVVYNRHHLRSCSGPSACNRSRNIARCVSS
mgnify:CR=1 FL=1